MHEIVKYHNHMNTVHFNGFNAIELNLLLSICSKIRDEGTHTVVYSFEDLRKLSQYTATATKSFVKSLENTYDKLIKLNFKIGTEIHFTKFVLFTEYTIDSENQEVTISVNSKFSYILNELTANFTRFELNEFVSLQSKYAKNLYRLLKQYRSTGKVYFTIDDFKNKLAIPRSYALCDIDRKVLKPIQTELYPLFQNFRIEKVKSKKRGTPVTHIHFSFTPQKLRQSKKNWTLQQIQEVYLPDFTLEEVNLLSRYGTHEQLKRAAKYYDNYKEFQFIVNKMGFMTNILKKLNKETKQVNSNVNLDYSFDRLVNLKDLI